MLLSPNLKDNQLFMHVFEHAPIGIVIVSLEGRILKLNRAALSYFGYEEHEIYNMSFYDITYHDDVEENKRFYEELLNGERETYQMVKRYIHRDGHLLWAQLNVSVSKINDGEPFLISQLIDLTEEKWFETQYKKSEEHYQLLVNNALYLIATITQDGTYTYVSPSSQQIIGYLSNELIGTRCSDTCHPEDLEHMTLFLTNILSVQGKGTVTHRAYHKSGRLLWLESTFIKVETGDKDTAFYIWSRDVTNKKMGQQRFRENKAHYKSLFDNHPDMVFSLNLKGEFTSVNSTGLKITGYSKSEILNTVKTYKSLIAPEQLEYVNAKFNQAVNGHVLQYECQLILKNGERIVIDVANIPIRVEEEVVGVYGIARNIQERRQADRALKAAHGRLESFIDHHLDAVFIFNLREELIKVNPTFDQIFGWDGQALLGLKFQDLPFIPKDELINSIERIKLLKEGKPVGHVETVRYKKDGTPVNTIVSSFTLFDEEGNPNGWATAFRDISEQKKAESLVINSEKLSIAGQLAAGIAHEIRNPLTAIKGFMQLVKSSEAQGSQNLQYFDIVSSEIERIEGIVSELLVLAKPQKVHYQKIDLTRLINEVVQLLDSQAILNNVLLSMDVPAKPSIIHGEPNQLKQSFINFIKNGIEAMPRGGTLKVTILDQNDQGYLIQFEDEGCGIPKELIDKLGQPFYTTKEKGTGLGFMVSKKIIEEHHGSLSIKSELNKGTLIEVKLPFKKSSSEPE